MGKIKEIVEFDFKDYIYRGLFVGGLVWLVFSFILLFKIIYSNYFIMNMNPGLNVSFFSFDYWLILLVSLVGSLIIFTIIFIIFYFFKKRIKFR